VHNCTRGTGEPGVTALDCSANTVQHCCISRKACERPVCTSTVKYQVMYEGSTECLKGAQRRWGQCTGRRGLTAVFSATRVFSGSELAWVAAQNVSEFYLSTWRQVVKNGEWAGGREGGRKGGGGPCTWLRRELTVRAFHLPTKKGGHKRGEEGGDG